MKKVILLLALTVFIIACKTETKKTEASELKKESKTELPVLALGEFDTKAGNYVNKEVKIQGIVDHVCKHSGKKLLVVTDDGKVHITSDTRFNDALQGSEISLTGIVLEERIDEAYCLKLEEDNIKSHSEGKSNKEQFERKKEHIQQYRNQMKADSTDHISKYSLEYVSHNEIK